MMLIDRSNTTLGFGLASLTKGGGEEEGGMVAGGRCPRCRQRLRKCCPPRPLKTRSDADCLTASLRALAECGWYYGNMTRRQSVARLQTASVGLFLLRDSCDPRFLFSLSVQTALGPTSIRIHYGEGGFRLDSEPSLIPTVPTFDSIITLVEHYIRQGDPQLFLSGSKYSHVLLRAPLYSEVPSLKHLSRLRLNTTLRSAGSNQIAPLPIPILLKQYLIDYPYTR